MDPHMTRVTKSPVALPALYRWSNPHPLVPETSGLLVKPACHPRLVYLEFVVTVYPPPSCSSYGDSHPMNHHSSDLAVRSWSNLSGLSRSNTNRHCHQVIWWKTSPCWSPVWAYYRRPPLHLHYNKWKNRPMPAPCTCSRTPRWHLRPGSPWVRCHRPRFLGSWSTGHGSRCHCHNLAGVEGPGQ